MKTSKVSHRLVNRSVMALLALLALPGVALAAAESCGDGGGGSQDIGALTASFDQASGDILVELTLCAAPDETTKYRVHFDHTAPFAPDADRNGDGFVNAGDFCVTTSDDGMMHRAKKDNGPGVIEVDGSVLRYTVNVVELNPDLTDGDTVLVWADTQNRGIKDRAPDTNASDGCDEPEVAGEYIELALAPPAGCAAGDRYQDQGDGTVLDCTTDLVWLQDASCDALGPFGNGRATWSGAIAAAAALSDGTCGLSDGSEDGAWRLPTISEFCSAWSGSALFPCPSSAAPDSLIDSSAGPPTVATGHPFVGVRSSAYWSATESDAFNAAWDVYLNVGFVSGVDSKGDFNVVWPVRGGP